jgi:type I site-specific restriction endonuclease
VPTCGFVVRYQNTSNLEQHYIRGGPDHKELADRLAGMQQLDRQQKLASGADGRMVLSRTFNAPAFTAEKKALCDMKFVKWLVRKSRALTMGRQDDELNEFIEEVNDGAYTLPCYEVILKLVKQMQAWGDARIDWQEITLKASINTKLPTCDDKGVFT